jgi:T4 superinfection immunity protein
MLAVTIPLVIGYWLPSFVAIARGHQSWWAIVALNLFLGWTVLGWIFALVWSLTALRGETAVTLRERFHGGGKGEDARLSPNQRERRS